MGKKKSDIRTIIEAGHQLYMCRDTYDYIQQLKNRNDALERENVKLTNELNAIKPVLATGGVKPAVHHLCGDCRFVVKSTWNSQIIGCSKDCVCDDFYPLEK